MLNKKLRIMKTFDSYFKSGLGKSFQCLMMVLFNYGHSHLIEGAKSWCEMARKADFDKATFKFGLFTEVTIALADLSADMRDMVLRGHSHNCKSLVASIKLIERLL